MRKWVFFSAVAAVAPLSPALAADQLKFGPPPAWVVPLAVPPVPGSTQNKPVVLLLHDQQTRLEPNRISNYSAVAFKIQKPEGLAAGNLSISWNPATDSATINKLEIRRGDQVIDVLKAGQTFTTMRRESNLEAAMLDGMLTANIQPEGLQEGDVVILATTTEHVDPVLKGHVESVFSLWGDAQIGLAHARLVWPSNLQLKLQKTGDIPPPQQPAMREGMNAYELTMRDADPVIAPKEAPVRFKIGRMGEATDFRSWADAARLLMPLFAGAAAIPASGPLRDEVEKIRRSSSDPKARAEQTLQLVEERIRYVALLMGQGGLVPASAETTWSRRFGDCKAKTALMLGILHELGIAAEPVAVNPMLGNAIADRLPMIGLFNHVLVRAHIGGKAYWLDGTRTGDTSLDDIEVPNFGWGLPVVPDARLVSITSSPRRTPDHERQVEVDASGGVYAPAAIRLTETYRGDAAVELNVLYSSLSEAQRDEALRKNALDYFDGFEVTTSSVQFDKAKREIAILISGTAKLDWKDNWFYVPTSSIAFKPEFERPAGPFHDAPIAVAHPRFIKDIAAIRLPAGFAAQQKLDPAVHETLAGVEYARAESVAGDTLTVESSERSLVSEVAYKDATAAAGRLRALSKDNIYLRMAANYQLAEKDWPALAEKTPGSAAEYRQRGNIYLDGSKFDQAIADFSEALKLEPTNEWALADRGISRVWKHQYDDAEKDLAAAEKLEPDNVVVWRARGLLAKLKGECAKAVDFFTRSLAKEPDNAFALGHRAICEAQLSKDDDALADSAQALRVTPSWIDLRILRANIFMGRGKRDLVASEADTLVRENPKSEYAWVGAGKTYAALGRRDEALRAFDQALAIKPYAYVYLNREQVRPIGDLKNRMADLNEGLKVEPDNSDVLAEKARLLARTGDYKGALSSLDRVKADTSDRYYMLQRALVLHQAGRTAEAQRLFADVRAKSSTATELNNLCWAKATAGVMLESAVQDCHDAMTLSPDNAAYLDSLGMVLLKLGRVDEALTVYNQALAKRRDAPTSLMGRAIVYTRKGDAAHAGTDAAAARQLYPEIDDLFSEYGLKL